jgi:hypothetical protein
MTINHTIVKVEKSESAGDCIFFNKSKRGSHNQAQHFLLSVVDYLTICHIVVLSRKIKHWVFLTTNPVLVMNFAQNTAVIFSKSETEGYRNEQDALL